MDRFDDMAMFQIIARTGTISATAGELNVAPSAVSRRLKALEERLGVQLLQRTTRQMQLTDAGITYLEGAGQVLGALEALESDLQAGAGTLSGTVRITAPLSFGLIALPDVLDSFMRQHPGVFIDLTLTDVTVDLVAEGFDLALRIGVLSNSSLIARRLCGVDFAACASPAFLKTAGKIETPADLDGLPGCIYANKPQGAVLPWKRNGEQGQVVLRPVFRSNNGDVLRDLAVRGHGIVCEPRFILADAIDRGDLVELLPEYKWLGADLHAVYPPTAHMPRRVRAVIDHVAAALKL